MNRPSPASRLLIRDELADVLHGFDQGDIRGLSVFGTTDLDEILLRLAGACYVLVLLHKVDDCGRCRRCRPKTRRWPYWPTRKATCRVLSVTNFFATATTEEIWQWLLPRIGVRRELDKIRAHLANRAAERDPTNTVPIPTQTSWSSRHALHHNGTDTPSISSQSIDLGSKHRLNQP
ncbi:hypothetical protein [Kutzneria sp. NPDC052558]|uniref:hypothetical protein n=1 Tax=Kutzneria sp. NPDC052558 TaxID=3364121 RepID=UPI0037C5BAB3